MKSEIFVEFNDFKVEQKELIEAAKEIWKENGNKVKDLKSIELYLKPAERKCYYVFNGEGGDNNFFEV